LTWLSKTHIKKINYSLFELTCFNEELTIRANLFSEELTIRANLFNEELTVRANLFSEELTIRANLFSEEFILITLNVLSFNISKTCTRLFSDINSLSSINLLNEPYVFLTILVQFL